MVGAERAISHGYSWNYEAAVPQVRARRAGSQGWTMLEEETQMQTLLETKPPKSEVGSTEVPGIRLEPR